MGDILVWLVLGTFVVLIFCIYSLSSQLESRIRLAVEIITGNQRRILQQLETLNRDGPKLSTPNVVVFDRRKSQRRRSQPDDAFANDRRQHRGRRRDDSFLFDDSRNAVLARSES